MLAPRIFDARLAIASGAVLPSPCLGWRTSARARTAPLQALEQNVPPPGFFAHDLGRLNSDPHSRQVRSAQHAGSRPRGALGAESSALLHAGLHDFARTACSFVSTTKSPEQARQVFQNGYARRAFPCNVPRERESVSAASFNQAAVSWGDKLVGALANEAHSLAVKVESRLGGNVAP